MGAGKEQTVTSREWLQLSIHDELAYFSVSCSCSPCLFYLLLNKKKPPHLACSLESNDPTIMAGPLAITQEEKHEENSNGDNQTTYYYI